MGRQASVGSSSLLLLLKIVYLSIDESLVVMMIPRIVKEVVLSLSLMVVILYKRKEAVLTISAGLGKVKKKRVTVMSIGREVVVFLYPRVVQAWERYPREPTFP